MTSPTLGEGGSAKRWCYSMRLFCKMGDKGEGRDKIFKKWETSFMDRSLVFFSRCQGFLPVTKSRILTSKPRLFWENTVLCRTPCTHHDKHSHIRLLSSPILSDGAGSYPNSANNFYECKKRKEKKTLFKNPKVPNFWVYIPDPSLIIM